MTLCGSVRARRSSNISWINTFTLSKMCQTITSSEMRNSYRCARIKAKNPLLTVAPSRRRWVVYVFPLYFFDYETYAPAIPAFDGFSAVSENSVSVFVAYPARKGGEPEHVEFLQLDRSDPTRPLPNCLIGISRPEGTVVVWYAPFERGVNKEIGDRNSAYAKAMERINAQIRDLRDIFSDQHYVHPGFRGSTSIKHVLPVLVPDLSYEELSILGKGRRRPNVGG